jgi:hypothetical protein
MFLMLFPKFPCVLHVCSLHPFLRFGEMFLNVVFKFPMCLSCVVYIHPIGFAECSLCCSHSSHVSLLSFLSLTFYHIIKVHIIIIFDKFCPIFEQKNRKILGFFLMSVNLTNFGKFFWKKMLIYRNLKIERRRRKLSSKVLLF